MCSTFRIHQELKFSDYYKLYEAEDESISILIQGSNTF